MAQLNYLSLIVKVMKLGNSSLYCDTLRPGDLNYYTTLIAKVT